MSVHLVLDFNSKFAQMIQVHTWESGICFREHFLRIQTIQVPTYKKSPSLSIPYPVTHFVYILIIYILHMCTAFTPYSLDLAYVHTLATTSVWIEYHDAGTYVNLNKKDQKMVENKHFLDKKICHYMS